MQYSDLKYAILATLSYFHIFQYPLSDLEIWKMLFQENPSSQSFGETNKTQKHENQNSNDNISLIEIRRAIEELKQKKIIEEKNGFYFLAYSRRGEKYANAGNMAATRMERSRLAEKKYKKALRVIKILRCIPFVKMIGVCNSLSYNNACEESDIDIFIISSAGKIWTTRLIAAGILKILRLRPTETNSKDKICASFFISEGNLNLEKIQIIPPLLKEGTGGISLCDNPANVKRTNSLRYHIDIYLLYWIATLVPIYDKKETYAKFIAANRWIKNSLPNWEQYKNLERRITSNKILSLPFYLLTLFIPENLSKKIQMRIMPDHLKRMANKDTQVITTDCMLKFHDKDRREVYYEEWQSMINRIKESLKI
ncbi:MAG: hypothetical protein V1770_03905 [bacterium]